MNGPAPRQRCGAQMRNGKTCTRAIGHGGDGNGGAGHSSSDRAMLPSPFPEHLLKDKPVPPTPRSTISGDFRYTDRARYAEYRAMLGGIEIEWCSGCGSYRSLVHRHTGRRQMNNALTGDVIEIDAG